MSSQPVSMHNNVSSHPETEKNKNKHEDTTTSSSNNELENVSFSSRCSSAGRGAAADLGSLARAQYQYNNNEQHGVADTSVEAGAVQHEAGAEDSGEQQPFNVVGSTILFLTTGLPLSLSALAQFSLNAVIVAVIGRMVGVEEMGGAALAVGLVNATGFAFGAGLCGAMETVLSHTYGKYEKEKAAAEAERAHDTTGMAKEPPKTLYMYGTYAQRMAFILLVAAVPLGLVLCFADVLLSAGGTKPAAAHYSGLWCRYAVYGIPAALLFQLIMRYYSSQRVTLPVSVSMFVAALVNPLLQLLFVKLFGYVGSPIAWVILMCSICSSLIAYFCFTNMHKLTWGGWSRKSLQNMGGLLRIALPSMAIMLSEWVALEINALAAGTQPPVDLAGFSITLQVFGIIWGIGSGVIVISCVFVGNEIGAGRPLVARKMAFLSIVIVFVIAIIDVIIVIALGSFIPFWFTTEQEVAEVYWSLMRIVLPYHIFDTFQSTVMSILRGCGLQMVGAAIITVAFCVVGVPFAFVLMFHFKFGVKALWIGPFSGVLLVGCPCYVYLLFRHIKWAELKGEEEGHTTKHAAATDVVVQNEINNNDGDHQELSSFNSRKREEEKDGSAAAAAGGKSSKLNILRRQEVDTEQRQSDVRHYLDDVARAADDPSQ